MFYLLLVFEDLIWIFPAVRQIRGRLSFYFLSLACAGFIELVGLILPRFHIHAPRHFSPNFNIFVSILTIYFLFVSEALSKRKYILIALIPIVALMLIPWQSFRSATTILLICRIVIMGVFIKDLMAETAKRSQFSLFLLCLILYELSLVLRMGFGLAGTQVGLMYFYTSMIFETMLGIFFILFREDSRGIKIQIGKGA